LREQGCFLIDELREQRRKKQSRLGVGERGKKRRPVQLQACGPQAVSVLNAMLAMAIAATRVKASIVFGSMVPVL